MDKQQEPRLRFKGFTGAWECKKLGEISTSYSGGTPIVGNAKFYGGTIPFIRSGEIHSSKTELFLTQEGLENSSTKLVKKGDILYALYGATSGEVGRSQIDGAINQAILAIIPKENYKAEFISQWLKINKENIVSLYLQGGQGNLSGEIVKKIEISFPSSKEQTHLGLFFRRLDSQIAESRAVLEKSRQLKKAMLAKMFPANGEKIPKIRFEGFEGEWERKKLGEIAFKVKEKNIAYQYAETFTNSAEFGIISQQDFFDKSISNSENIGGYYVVQPDDFVYNPRISSFAPVGPIKRNKLGRTGVMSPLYYVFRLNDEIKPSYLEQYFEGNQWHHFMYLNGDTGARSDRFSIKNDVFAEMPISFPANKNEQTQIGNFFRQLDETIALQSAEVEKLNQLKKGLLAAMLV